MPFAGQRRANKPVNYLKIDKNENTLGTNGKRPIFRIPAKLKYVLNRKTLREIAQEKERWRED